MTIIPPAFASMVADLLGDLKGDGVENYDIQGVGRSVNFAKSKWCCASLKSVGMVVDRQGVRPAESDIAAVAELSTPTTVEELRAFLGMTGYLR